MIKKTKPSQTYNKETDNKSNIIAHTEGDIVPLHLHQNDYICCA